MPKIPYIEKRFAAKTEALIASAEEIIAQYQAQGFSLTLRQLYYQFVARGLLPNTEQSYNKLGNTISDARRAGLIDWTAIEDRTRFIRELSNWGKPQELLETAEKSYHRDLWAGQDTRLEVWIEKDALVGVIEEVCQTNDVPFFSCRGYVSDSEMWRGAMRMLKHTKAGANVIVLHLGDHDPSGIDMTRDISDRLSLFSGYGEIEVRRIALTMDQIDELGPPPNPAKVTDSRYVSYVDRFGEESWELDALEPQYISNLIETNILAERDEKKWAKANAQQEEERGQIGEIIERWGELFGEEA